MTRALDALRAAQESHRDIEHYTVFNPRNVFRTSNEVLELQAATGESLSPGREKGVVNLISFRPERIAQQFTIAEVNAFAKMGGDEAEFACISDVVFADYVSPKMEIVTPQILAIREKIQERVKAALEVMGTPAEADFDDQELLRRTKENHVKIVARVGDATANNLTEKYMVDALYNESKEIIDLVKSVIAQSMQEAQKDRIYEPLTMKPNSERTAHFSSGGPASGKGVLTANTLHSYPDGDVSIFGVDRLRPLVKPEKDCPTDSDLSPTQFTDLEADAVRRRVIGYQDEQITLGAAPDMIVETTGIHPLAVADYGRGGASVKLAVISVPAEVAIERANHRARFSENPQDRGRSLDDKYLLQVHSSDGRVLSNLLENLPSKILPDQNVSLEIKDNNVAKGEPARLAAEVDFGKKTIRVHDFNSFISIEQKSKIDPDKTKDEGIYSSEDKMPQNNISSLLKAAEVGWNIEYSDLAKLQIAEHGLNEALNITKELSAEVSAKESHEVLGVHTARVVAAEGGVKTAAVKGASDSFVDKVTQGGAGVESGARE